MKTEGKILVAFILNLAFSVFEFVGGLWIGSVAVLSDALHDLGDGISIGLSYLLERKSRRGPDARYTYGYGRYSVLGGLITTVILLLGSCAVIVGALHRLVNPTPIHYGGMILFALVGVAVNFAAAFFTREGDSINQKAVNLHMLEDVLGWAVVLIGAVIMRFTDLRILDPMMSVGVAGFILYHAAGNLRQVAGLFLLRTPDQMDLSQLQAHLLAVEGVLQIHHVHVWSLDGHNHSATMHVVARGDPHQIKEALRGELAEHGIVHATLELEAEGEQCHHIQCAPVLSVSGGHHHHHHH